MCIINRAQCRGWREFESIFALIISFMSNAFQGLTNIIEPFILVSLGVSNTLLSSATIINKTGHRRGCCSCFGCLEWSIVKLLLCLIVHETTSFGNEHNYIHYVFIYLLTDPLNWGADEVASPQKNNHFQDTWGRHIVFVLQQTIFLSHISELR